MAELKIDIFACDRVCLILKYFRKGFQLEIDGIIFSDDKMFCQILTVKITFKELTFLQIEIQVMLTLEGIVFIVQIHLE